MVSITEAPALPALRWQVLVDWFGDGLWNAQNVDASDDLAGVRWRWGRVGLPVPEFVGPATLELTLKNPQHRYTPGSLTSPLAGHVAPGREVWLRAASLYDDFETDAGSSEELDDRATTHGAVQWEVLTTPGNGFDASGGEVRGRVGRGVPSAALAVVETGDPLATLIVRYRRVSDADRGRYGLKSGCDIAWEGAPPSGILVVRPPDAGDPRCAFPANAIRCKKRLKRIYLTSPSHN